MSEQTDTFNPFMLYDYIEHAFGGVPFVVIRQSEWEAFKQYTKELLGPENVELVREKTPLDIIEIEVTKKACDEG